MQLIYLYFTYDKYNKKVFSDDIEMNFDSHLRFKIEGDRLVQDKSVGELPTGFFSISFECKSSPIIDGVSVVAGGNGSGKTSVAEVLRDIMESTSQLTKFERFVVVYRKHGDAICYCKSHNIDLQLPSSVKQCQDGFGSDYWASQWSGDFVYITPHFNLDRVLMLGDSNKFSIGQCECVDLSPLALAVSCVNRTSNPKPQSYREYKSWNHLGAYLKEQTKWMFEFADAERKLPADRRLLQERDGERRNGLPGLRFNPHGVTIAIDAVVDRMVMVGDISAGVKKILKKINTPDSTFCTNAFYAYAGLYLVDNRLNPTQSPRVPKEKRNGGRAKQMKEAWVKHWQYRKALLEFCLKNEQLCDSKIFEFFAWAKKYDCVQQEITGAEKCFKQILKVASLAAHDESVKFLNLHVVQSGSVQLTLTDQGSPDYLKEILLLVDLHFRAKSILDFLSFSPYPRMSAGEQSFFCTWGRLYNYYVGAVGSDGHDFATGEKGGSRPADHDALVYFDEAETTMHPDWQRQLVRFTIWFFETFAPWVHPHIIFATHSPMLLSDVPIGNVVLLAMREDGKSFVGNSLKRENTFAANVFDLYRESFFLKDGFSGIFAQEKLDTLLRKIKRIVVEEKTERIAFDEWALADLVGDPNVRKYFESIKPLVEKVQGKVL